MKFHILGTDWFLSSNSIVSCNCLWAFSITSTLSLQCLSTQQRDPERMKCLVLLELRSLLMGRSLFYYSSTILEAHIFSHSLLYYVHVYGCKLVYLTILVVCKLSRQVSRWLTILNLRMRGLNLLLTMS